MNPGEPVLSAPIKTARFGPYTVTCTVRGDHYVMMSDRPGASEHTLSVPHTCSRRLDAHWEGYTEDTSSRVPPTPPAPPAPPVRRELRETARFHGNFRWGPWAVMYTPPFGKGYRVTKSHLFDRAFNDCITVQRSLCGRRVPAGVEWDATLVCQDEPDNSRGACKRCIAIAIRDDLLVDPAP